MRGKKLPAVLSKDRSRPPFYDSRSCRRRALWYRVRLGLLAEDIDTPAGAHATAGTTVKATSKLKATKASTKALSDVFIFRAAMAVIVALFYFGRSIAGDSQSVEQPKPDPAE